METNVDLKEIQIQEEIGHAPSISVIGVGGGGNNTLGHLVRNGTFSNIRLMIANTDLQHMQNSPVKERILLGKKGLGAGMRPEQGRQAAEESYDEIKRALEHSDLVIISAGLGGGTGTGAAPVVARAAKEVGALTIAVVTKPFVFEGKKRMRLAEEGLKALYEVCDSVVVIPNQKLLNVIGKTTSYTESMSYIDDVVARAVNGISSVILKNSTTGVNVDFQDLKTVMEHKGMALMSIGEAEGEDAAQQAVKNAIESPLFDNISIIGSMGVIINYEFHPDFPFAEITKSMESIENAADDEADVMFGTMNQESFDKNKVRVSVIITGFDREQDSIMPAQIIESKNEPEVKVEKPKDVGSLFNFHYSKVSSSDLSEEELERPTWERMKQD